MSSLHRHTVSAPHRTHQAHIHLTHSSEQVLGAGFPPSKVGDAGPPCAQLQPVSPTVQLSNSVCVCRDI